MRDLVVSTRIPLLRNEFVRLLPLPETGFELKLVHIAFAEFSAILRELLEISIVELSFHKLVHFLGKSLRFLLERSISSWVSGISDRILFWLIFLLFFWLLFRFLLRLLF